MSLCVLHTHLYIFGWYYYQNKYTFYTNAIPKASSRWINKLKKKKCIQVIFIYIKVILESFIKFIILFIDKKKSYYIHMHVFIYKLSIIAGLFLIATLSLSLSLVFFLVT